MVTGQLTYKEIKWIFKLKDFELTIEQLRDSNYIQVQNQKSSIDINEEDQCTELRGYSFDDGKIFIFNYPRLVKKTLFGSRYTFIIDSYATFDRDILDVDSISIASEELNWFHDVSNAYSIQTSTAFSEGKIDVSLKTYSETDKAFHFMANNEKVDTLLKITRNVTIGATSPIRLYTEIKYNVEFKQDYNKIKDFIYLTINALNFLSYRRNTDINQIKLMSKDPESGLFKKIGNFYLKRNNSDYIENENTIKNRIITKNLLVDKLPILLEKLYSENIYLEHIPENSKDKNRQTPARFVLITAAFEWQVRHINEKLIEEYEDREKEYKIELLELIDKEIKDSQGKRKKYFKSAKSFLSKTNMSLSNKIKWALEAHSEILTTFINDIYELNGLELPKFHEIAERIQHQRNNYAHGNLDKEFDSLTILDLNIMEWLYYAIVLKSIGLSNEVIMKIINNLFKRGLAL